MPATLYGNAKNSLRSLIESAASEARIDVAWARLFWLYGPREQPGRLVADLVLKLAQGQEFPATDGRQSRDYMHVADAAAALAALLASDVTGPVNIATGIGVPVRDLVARVAASMGRTELLRLGTLPTRPREPPELVADVRRLREEVGFKPGFDLVNGGEDTLAWWRSRLTPPS